MPAPTTHTWLPVIAGASLTAAPVEHARAEQVIHAGGVQAAVGRAGGHEHRATDRLAAVGQGDHPVLAGGPQSDHAGVDQLSAEQDRLGSGPLAEAAAAMLGLWQGLMLERLTDPDTMPPETIATALAWLRSGAGQAPIGVRGREAAHDQ